MNRSSQFIFAMVLAVVATMLALAPSSHAGKKKTYDPNEVNIERALEKGNRAKFLVFAKSAYINESVNFMIDAETYFFSNAADRQPLAQKLLAQYIKKYAKQEINIPAEITNKLQARMKEFDAEKKIYSKDLFADARKEIMALVRTNLGTDNKAKWDAFAPTLKTPELMPK